MSLSINTSVVITDPTADRTLTMPDADVDLTDLNTLSGITIEDYGTSATTGTARTLGNLVIQYGEISVGANSSQAITNLNFTDATTYNAQATYESSSVGIDDTPNVVKDSGSQLTVYNGHTGTLTINWLAIGT